MKGMASSILLWFVLASPVAAQHHVEIYATDALTYPRHAHTFAVVDGKWCFSWMPAGPLRPFREQPGRNYTFAETLQWAKTYDTPVWYIGDCVLDDISYLRARVLHEDMLLGRISYGLLGPYNCMQVIARFKGSSAPTGISRGIEGSQQVLEHLRK